MFGTEIVTAASSRTSLEMKFEAECGTPDAAVTMPLERTDPPVCLQNDVIITRDDVATVEFFDTPWGQNGILMTTTDAGARKLASATSGNVGKGIGVVIAGRLITVAVIREPVAKELVVSGPFSREETEALVQMLK